MSTTPNTRLQETYQHALQLRQELTRWLDQSIQKDGPSRHGGGEDEANYSLAWFPHYLVTGDSKIEERFRSLLADLKNWVDTECFHGYEKRAEAHHGTEPFLLFLPRYHGMFPADETAGALLEDAAHHIGNWVDGIPEWYDYERDCFYSYQLGTEFVSDDPVFAFEISEHFRFIHIALAAYRSTGQQRYLDWSLRYGKKRAERILATGDLPIPKMWDLDGNSVYERKVSREHWAMAADNHHVSGDPLTGIENLLASGAVYVLGDLFMLSGEGLFQEAARKIIEPLVNELLDPFADPAAAVISYYRWAFRDTSLDERISLKLESMPASSDQPLAMVVPQEYVRREPGVGKRNDMLYWGHWSDDGSVARTVQPCTATLTLAYQITGEVEFAQRALHSAATKLLMARRVLRGGREHADMGGAICSVAAGHGRNWGQGAVTGCYGPLLLGTTEVLSKVTGLIEVRDEQDQARLPEAILSLVRPPVGESGEVLFFNGSEEAATFSWRCEEEWKQVRLDAGAEASFKIKSG